MIKSFADKETEKVFNQRFSRLLPHDIQRVALRKLILISKARSLDDLRAPPGNRLEALAGNRVVLLLFQHDTELISLFVA